MIAELNAAKGDAFIAMDDDMQTHPSQLKFLLGKFEEGTGDICMAITAQEAQQIPEFRQLYQLSVCADSSEKAEGSEDIELLGD